MSNEVKTYNYIDRSKFRVNFAAGLTLFIFRAADEVFQGKSQNNKVYQCSCGAIFVVPLDSVDKVPKDSRGNLLCSECGNYSFKIIGIPHLDSEGIKTARGEIDKLFNQAMEQNLLTLALYGRVITSLFNEEILSILHSMDNFREQIYGIEVLEYIDRFGIVPIVWSRDSHKRTIGLKLLQYCQLVELARIYQMLHDLVLVALNKVRLEDANGFSPSGSLRSMSLSAIILNPISPANRIVYDQDYAIPLHQRNRYKLEVCGKGKQKNFGRRSPTRASVEALSKLCDKYGVGLADHVRFFYDNQLRNAFAHSQYEIESGHIYLTRYGRRIQTEHFEKMLERCHVLFELFLSKLSRLNQITLTTYWGGPIQKHLGQPILFVVNT